MKKILAVLVLAASYAGAESPVNKLECAPNGNWCVIYRIADNSWIQAWGSVPPTPTVAPQVGDQYRDTTAKKTFRWTGPGWVLANTWSLSTIDSQVFTLPCCAPVVNANTISATGIVFHITAGATRLRTINVLNVGTVIVLLFDTTVIVEDNTGNIDLNGTFNAVANSTLTLASDGVKWYEIARKP